MKIVINYANETYKKTQEYCTKTAYKYGADKVIEYSPSSIDNSFYEKYKNILMCCRGNGYWLWKPYIISKSLNDMEYGDYLFYVDSGSYFINSIDYLISCMNENRDDIISFSLPFLEKQWTKREIFEYFNCQNNSAIMDTCQRLATFILIKKTKRTVDFITSFLTAAVSGTLITDQLNEEQKECPDFIENRHDQSIFSVLSKLEGVPIYRDPSEYGIQPKLLSKSYKDAMFIIDTDVATDYPQILVLHRKKNVDIFVRIMSWIRSNMPWQLYRMALKVQNIIKIIKVKYIQ